MVESIEKSIKSCYCTLYVQETVRATYSSSSCRFPLHAALFFLLFPVYSSLLGFSRLQSLFPQLGETMDSVYVSHLELLLEIFFRQYTTISVGLNSFSLSLRDHSFLLLDVQCLGFHCFIYFVLFFSHLSYF